MSYFCAIALMAPEVTDSLVLVPRQMYIRRIIRHKFVLKSKFQIENPDRRAFEIAALPPAPLHKCMADASLLADIIVSKYHYHLPFYRVIESYKELGVSISASAINDWFKAVVGKLKPIYDLLRAHVLACDYVQVDESTLPVIDNEKHRAVKGYVWSVVDVMAKDRFFFYEHGSRSARVAMGLLKDFQGAIQSDGYCVYEHFEGMERNLLKCPPKSLMEEAIAYTSQETQCLRWSSDTFFVEFEHWIFLHMQFGSCTYAYRDSPWECNLDNLPSGITADLPFCGGGNQYNPSVDGISEAHIENGVFTCASMTAGFEDTGHDPFIFAFLVRDND